MAAIRKRVYKRANILAGLPPHLSSDGMDAEQLDKLMAVFRSMGGE